jgi:protein TonB
MQTAEFPGGAKALITYLKENMKYSDEARKKHIKGYVYLGFIVEKDGTLSNIKILRSPDESLNEEAIRLIKASPKWVPAKQNGEVVREAYTLPIHFDLKA